MNAMFTFSGYVVGLKEPRTLPNGTKMVNFGVSIRDDFSNPDPMQRSHIYNFTAFNDKKVEYIMDFMNAGCNHMHGTANVKQVSYVDKNGQTVKTFNFTISDCKLLKAEKLEFELVDLKQEPKQRYDQKAENKKEEQEKPAPKKEMPEELPF